MITISIGILAYNEEKGIARTVQSLLSQKLDAPADDENAHPIRAEIVVVPNGCTDNTADVAQKAVEEHEPVSDEDAGFFAARVCEIKEPGKENAWNNYVDNFSYKDADILVFTDADIKLAHERVLYDLINTLLNTEGCVVAGGNPTKHIENKKQKSAKDRLSIGATTLRKGMKGIFAGCLYCGYADTIRSLYLPTVLMGEDAFVRAQIVTKGFTHPGDENLIVRADDAKVIFESYMSPAEIIRNKTRRLIGLSINAIIYTKLWAESTPEKPAGALMRELQEQDPQWSQKLINSTFESRGFWAVPRHHIYKQFLQLKHHSLKSKLKLLPVALATLPLNAIAVIKANRRIAKGEIRSLWNKADES
tara:strand:+ start:8035 stop:9123 length:1089 start_codon:yes stop_codon:yes gene_type:complete